MVKRWLTAALCMVLMLGTGWIHPLLLILPLLLLPVMGTLLVSLRLRVAAAVMAAGLAAEAYCLLPADALPAVFVLCAGSAWLSFRSGTDSRQRGIQQCMLCIATLFCALITALPLFAGKGIDAAVADKLTELLKQDRDCNRYLVLLYQSGMLSLKQPSFLGFEVGGYTLLLPYVRTQLLLLFRERAVWLTQALLCIVCGAWPVLCGLLSAGISDRIGFARSRLRDLPAFTDWQPNGRQGTAICLGVILLCFPSYTAGTAISTVTQVLSAALTAACCVFGTAVLCGLIGRRSKCLFVLACAVGTALSVFSPTLMPLVVMTDRMFDFRGIRPAAPEDPE